MSWITSEIPAFVEKVSSDAAMTKLEPFDAVFNNIDLEGVKIPWPQRKMKVFAVNDGNSHTEENISRFQAIFRDFQSENVIFWWPYSLDLGVFQSKFTQGLLDWIDREVVLTPVVFTSVDDNLVIIIDEEMSITLLCVSENFTSYIENNFGPIKILQKNFLNSIERYYSVEHQSFDRNWLLANIYERCDWNWNRNEKQ